MKSPNEFITSYAVVIFKAENYGLARARRNEREFLFIHNETGYGHQILCFCFYLIR